MRSAAPKLPFTVEKTEEGVLHFLDVSLQVRDGLCWEYNILSKQQFFRNGAVMQKIFKVEVYKQYKQGVKSLLEML